MIKYFVLLPALALLWCACGPSTPRNDNPAYHNPAIQAFTDSIEATPDNAAGYFNRAEALSDMGQDSLALVDVQSALQLDEKNPQYHFTQGYLLLQLDKPREAIKVLRQCLDLSPGNANVRLLLSKAYLADHNTAAAQEQVSKILAAAPQHLPAQMIQAQIKAAQKDTAGAIQAIKSILAADPRNYQASFQLADWYKASGNPEAPIQYKATFALDTTNADPLFEIGDFYRQQQQWEKAKAAYRICMQIDMDYTEAYVQIGKILYQQDSTEKALRHFNLAILTMPNSAESYFNKGLCFEKLKLRDSAALAYGQALTFDNSLKEAADGLNRLKNKAK